MYQLLKYDILANCRTSPAKEIVNFLCHVMSSSVMYAMMFPNVTQLQTKTLVISLWYKLIDYSFPATLSFIIGVLLTPVTHNAVHFSTLVNCLTAKWRFAPAATIRLTLDWNELAATNVFPLKLRSSNSFCGPFSMVKPTTTLWATHPECILNMLTILSRLDIFHVSTAYHSVFLM